MPIYIRLPSNAPMCQHRGLQAPVHLQGVTMDMRGDERQADRWHHAMGVLSDQSITCMCAPMFIKCMVNQPVAKTAP